MIVVLVSCPKLDNSEQDWVADEEQQFIIFYEPKIRNMQKVGSNPVLL